VLTTSRVMAQHSTHLVNAVSPDSLTFTNHEQAGKPFVSGFKIGNEMPEQRLQLSEHPRRADVASTLLGLVLVVVEST